MLGYKVGMNSALPSLKCLPASLVKWRLCVQTLSLHLLSVTYVGGTTKKEWGFLMLAGLHSSY